MAPTQKTDSGDQKKEAAMPSEQISVHDGYSESVNNYTTALKLAAAHEGYEIDAVAEKKLVRKIDWLLMPLVGLSRFNQLLRGYDLS